MELLRSLIELLGHGVCHQLPSRSFVSDGWVFPVCSRDTGTFLAFTVSFIILFVLHRKRHPQDLPPTPYLLAFGLLVIPLAIDGLTSYAGLRTTTNLIRFLTGVIMGTGLGGVMYALLGSTLMARTSPGYIFEGHKHLLPWLVGTPIVAAVIGHLITRMGVVGAVFSASTIIFTFTVVALAALGLTKRFTRRVRTASDLVLPLVGALLIALALLIGMAKLRDLILGTLLGTRLL